MLIIFWFKRGTYSRHATDVLSAAENRGIRHDIRTSRRGTRFIRPLRSHGRDIFHNIAHDHVHKQYRHSRAYGPDCPKQRNRDRGKPDTFPVCGDGRGKHVFRFPLFYPPERPRNAGRAIYLHGLHKGRIAAANHYGHSNGIRPSRTFPFLSPENVPNFAYLWLQKLI